MKKRTILDFLSSQDTTPKKQCRKNKIEINNKENIKEIEINKEGIKINNKENTKEIEINNRKNKIEINNNKNKPFINKEEIKETNKICIKETKVINDNLLNKKHSQSNTTYNEYIPLSNESITPPTPSKNTPTKQSDRYPFLKNILDANRNPPTHPCYDPSTLYIDPTYLSTLTPFEQQFWNIKKNHFNTIVCFKKGKFYELYENDAEIGNKHFNLKLTDRVNMKMAGFPEAKFNYWAQEFLKKGYNIARIEQEENRIQQKIRLKNSNKGKSDKNKIIERKLKEIITPSTIYNYEMLPNNNIIYLCSIVKVKYNDKMHNDNNKIHNDNNNNIITNNYTISLLDCCSNKLYYTSTNDINKIIENNKIKEIITEEELEYKNIKIINTKELYNKYNYNMNNKSDINISMSDMGTISNISDISMNNSNNDNNDGDNCNNNDNNDNNNITTNQTTINMNNLSIEERKSIEIIKIYLLLLNRRIDNIEILPYKHSMLIDNITIKNLNLIKDNNYNSNNNNITHTNLNTDNTDNSNLTSTNLNIDNSNNINTLLERIDYTLTPYGRRKLISCILSPLSSVKDILCRRILTHYIRNKDIIEIKEIEDIERVMGRLNNYKIKDIEFIIRNINKSKKILNNIIDNNGYDDGNSDGDNGNDNNDNDNDDILDNNNNNNNKFSSNNVINNFNRRIKNIISEIDIFIEVFNNKYKIEEDNIIKIYNNDINIDDNNEDNHHHTTNNINNNTNHHHTNNNNIIDNNITKILNKLEEYRIQEEERIGYSIKYKNIGKDIFLLEIDKNNNYKYTTEYILHSSTKSVNRYYTKDLLSLVYEYKEQLEIEYINSKHSIIECIEYIIHNSNIIYNTIDILAEIDVYRSYYEYNSISNSIYSILIDHSKIDNDNVGGIYKYNSNNDINGSKDITDISLTYTNPNNNNNTFNNIYSPIINIKGMKNPIYPSYVSNDININNTIILTGANMGGKSTLLRSICYNVILNQMGLGISIEDNNNDNRYYNDNDNTCKVIDYEEYINNIINTESNINNTNTNNNHITNNITNNNYMSIFDKIYTRIGASDNLLEGISTFQNEMKECSTILNGITNRSLIIMDELGRGTSTVDGSAIAMSVINYISNNTCDNRYDNMHGNKIIRRPLLLFSTHYNNIIYKLLNNHNNTDNHITSIDSNDNSNITSTSITTNNHTTNNINIKPMYMKTLLNNNDIIFCYKLVDGIADSSLGIKVARLAGVDSKIIDRAEEILKQL